MLNLSELENVHTDIETVHEVVQCLKARIDGFYIGIHILKNREGNYFYELSHCYRGADNAGPSVAMENRFTTVDEAARGALQSATMCYRRTDEGGSWLRNDSFVQ
ncbi:hypothetical protein PAECIP111891_00407 [Paenibacillus allorhizoplanae]|uniref:Uncharacterized protein n=1 Tax=Paenibacillus allorhizoplanae TaxID=2905648 RepID=A0ABN8FYH8_9BACL|nr:hypothetical protein [Paenibacillus allorhizoplanae]CAH1192654.1 hypothetical protein PAECIP111891_00407 [Paenibacillus allorhizoplanae]